MKRKLLLGLCVAVGGVFATCASTVVHYHFNDFPVGYAVQETDRYLNAANTNTYAAIPRKPAGGDEFITKFPEPYPFTPGLAVYDPVSQEIYRNPGAVHIQRGKKRGSYVEIPSDANLLSGPEFTVEFFYCPVSVPHKEYGNYLYYKANLMNGYCPAAGTTYHWLNFVYKDSDGANQTLTYATNIHDADAAHSNVWYHLAFTVDVTKGEYKMFYNYLQVGTTKTFTGTLRDHSANSFFIGATNESNNADISVAEFRISDKALAPEQFLKLCSPNALPETTHYFDFDNPTNLNWNTSAYRNNAPAKYETNGKLTDSSGKCGKVTDSVPGSVVRNGLLAPTDEQTSNERSLAFTCKDDDINTSGRFSMSGGKKLWTTDFTLEFDFKSPPVPTDIISDSAWIFYCDFMGCARIWPSTGNMSIRFPGVSDGTRFVSGVANDKWHHIAYVFDKAALRHAFYVDGVAKHTWTSSLPTSPSDDTIYFGQMPNWGTGYALQNARFDNIRITQKALRPSEFLTEKTYEGETLAWYSYEDGRLDNGVYTNSVKGATLSGSAAVSSRKPGKSLLDKDGDVLRENARSLSLVSGKAVYARNALLERADLTVELFARETASSPNAGMLSLCCTTNAAPTGVNDPTDVMWALRVGADGCTPELYVTNETAQVVAFPAGSELTSGRWRHYAFSFAEDGADTTVRMYVDWALVKTATLTGKIRLPSAATGVIPLLGATAADAGSFNGLVDEVRVMRGEVGLDAFLRVPPAPGLVLLFR